MKHKRYKVEVFTTENSDNIIILLDLKLNKVFYAFTSSSYSAFINYGSSYDRLIEILKQAPYKAVSVLKGYSNNRNYKLTAKKVKTILAQKERSND